MGAPRGAAISLAIWPMGHRVRGEGLNAFTIPAKPHAHVTEVLAAVSSWMLDKVAKSWLTV